MLIVVTSRYLDLIRAGRKTSTVRAWASSKVQPGDPLTFSNYRTSARGRCTAVESRRVRDLTDQDARADGFRDRGELLEALHRHYPALTPNDGVVVVRFVLVDDDEAFPLFPQSGKSARS